jgi:hypothetical protein
MRRMLKSMNTAAAGLTAAGLLLAAGGLMHPQADSDAGYEAALAGMFDASAWTASHALVLLGYVVLACAATLLVRSGTDLPAGVRTAGWAVAIGATLGAIETVPHLLAASESTALVDGDATPLTDTHALLQVVTTPAVGLSLAALALTSARDRVLSNGRVAAAVAVAGGVALALSGPLLFLTEDPAFSPLFAGSAALAIWLVLAGARTSRRLRVDAGRDGVTTRARARGAHAG